MSKHVGRMINSEKSKPHIFPLHFQEILLKTSKKREKEMNLRKTSKKGKKTIPKSFRS
jgi:hypothetical protein